MSTMNAPEVMVTITEAAATEVQKFMVAEQVAPEVGGLRVSVQPGGCSGFNYTLDLTEVQKDSDEAWSFTYGRTPAVSTAALGEESNGGGTATATATSGGETFTVTVVCDPKSYLYLNGTVIDFKDEIMGSGFVFNNPNSTSTCGCGSSFSA